jgi:hypothetical protein
MTRINIVNYLLVLLLLLMACSIYDPEKWKKESPQYVFFAGNHELMSLNSLIKTSEKSKSSGNGWFFVVIGNLSYSQETSKTEERIVRFAWKNNYGQFVVSELPMSLVRFQISKDSLNPYCKFRWTPNSGWFNEKEWVEDVQYVVFVLKENQIYKNDIKLDLK